MRASLFSPILILLIITLSTKASILFGRIQEQTTYAMDTSTSSILIDTAYAKIDDSPMQTGINRGNDNIANSSNTPGNGAIADEGHLSGQSFDSRNNTTATQMTANGVAEINHAGQTSSGQTKQAEKSNEEFTVRTAEDKAKNNVVNTMTRSEIELLKELAKRRDKLENERKSLTMHEQVLKATEDKLDQKVDELKALQAQVEDLLKQYEQKENSKIMSLVKIYETMKPKDAAKIFNELEMPVLIRVVSNMKEVKLAPIIASMNPPKARELSIELAKQKPIG